MQLSTDREELNHGNRKLSRWHPTRVFDLLACHLGSILARSHYHPYLGLQCEYIRAMRWLFHPSRHIICLSAPSVECAEAVQIISEKRSEMHVSSSLGALTTLSTVPSIALANGVVS